MRHAATSGSSRSGRPRRRGLATLAVLWAIALVAIVLVSIQGDAFRQAAAGRDAVARVRAYWAARAGLEAQIAALSGATLSPDLSSAFTATTDMEAAASGTLEGARYRVAYTDETGVEREGPLDAHSRLNVNLMTSEDLLLLDGMGEAEAEAIVSWVNGALDDPASQAAAGVYEGLKYPYKPREGPVRSLKELELVTGIDPTLLRGEDANYNGVLDPSEDDGDLSPPSDNADGVLERGWSRFLTAVSEPGSYALSGRRRIDLSTASVGDIAARLSVDQTQAQVISEHAAGGGTLGDFVRSELSALVSTTDQSGATRLDGGGNVRALTDAQLRTLLDEASDGSEALNPRGGKVNINTVSRETLERQAQIDEETADRLIEARDARSGGFVSVLDLLEVEGIDRDTLASLMDWIDVTSAVYQVTVRGRDEATGIEVEIQAVIDRSTIPVVIRDLVVR